MVKDITELIEQISKSYNENAVLTDNLIKEEFSSLPVYSFGDLIKEKKDYQKVLIDAFSEDYEKYIGNSLRCVGLWSHNNCGVIFVHAEEDCEVPVHCHKELEIFITITGHSEYLIEGEVWTQDKGQVVTVNPNERHGAFYKKGCQAIVVSIPRNEHFPLSPILPIPLKGEFE